jgi:signal transduction histidine kinase
MLNRQILLLTIGVWSAAWGFYMSPVFILGENKPQMVAFLAGCSVFGATQCLILYQLIRRTRPLPMRWRTTLVIAAAFVAVGVHALLDTEVYQWIFSPRLVFRPEVPVRQFGYFYLTNFVMLAPTYSLYLAGVALTLAALANEDKERRLAAAQAAMQEAQLTALRLQINPHFLFNALNAVTALVGAGRNAEASQVVARLSSFFRATLNTPPGEMVRLEEELDVIGSYLDIEAARFGPRLAAEIDCADAVAEALVPHFLLQPLVENAIKHGVARSKATVRLEIAAEARAGRLVLRVADDAGPLDGALPPGAGVGLQNVAQRLAALYGDAARLTTGRQGRRFLAEIEMPLSLQRPEREAA